MRVPRVFCYQELSVDREIVLPSQAANRVVTVLRMRTGDSIVLFNGIGGEYIAEIIAVNKKQVVIKPVKFVARNLESPLKIHLGQVISRGERMDMTIQKSVELGVFSITPLFTERCGVKLSRERLHKRIEHWRAVAINACEQCGRNSIPEIHIACSLKRWLDQRRDGLCLILDHLAQRGFCDLRQTHSEVTLLIGSEGGLSLSEIELAMQSDFLSVSFGKRILRTETASLAAISILQAIWGDLR